MDELLYDPYYDEMVPPNIAINFSDVQNSRTNQDLDESMANKLGLGKERNIFENQGKSVSMFAEESKVSLIQKRNFKFKPAGEREKDEGVQLTEGEELKENEEEGPRNIDLEILPVKINTSAASPLNHKFKHKNESPFE